MVVMCSWLCGSAGGSAGGVAGGSVEILVVVVWRYGGVVQWWSGCAFILLRRRNIFRVIPND